MSLLKTYHDEEIEVEVRHFAQLQLHWWIERMSQRAHASCCWLWFLTCMLAAVNVSLPVSVSGRTGLLVDETSCYGSFISRRTKRKFFFCFPPTSLNSCCTREQGAPSASFRSYATKREPLPASLCGFHKADFDIYHCATKHRFILLHLNTLML